MGGEEAERSSFAARVVILPLEGNVFLSITGKKTHLSECILGPKEPFSYVCVSKVEEQVSRWCAGVFLTPASGLV